MVTILLDTMLYMNYICVLLPNCGEDLSPLKNNPHATLMFLHCIQVFVAKKKKWQQNNWPHALYKCKIC